MDRDFYNSKDGMLKLVKELNDRKVTNIEKPCSMLPNTGEGGAAAPGEGPGPVIPDYTN